MDSEGKNAGYQKKEFKKAIIIGLESYSFSLFTFRGAISLVGQLGVDCAADKPQRNGEANRAASCHKQKQSSLHSTNSLYSKAGCVSFFFPVKFYRFLIRSIFQLCCFTISSFVSNLVGSSCLYYFSVRIVLV